MIVAVSALRVLGCAEAAKWRNILVLLFYQPLHEVIT